MSRRSPAHGSRLLSLRAVLLVCVWFLMLPGHSVAQSQSASPETPEPNLFDSYASSRASPAISTLLGTTAGIFAPGTGHYYTGEYVRGGILTGLFFSFLIPSSLLKENHRDAALGLGIGAGFVQIFSMIDSYFSAKRRNRRLAESFGLSPEAAERYARSRMSRFSRFLSPNTPRSHPDLMSLTVEAGGGPTMNLAGLGVGMYLPVFNGWIAFEPFFNLGVRAATIHPVYTPGLRVSGGGRHRGFLEYGQGIYYGPWSYEGSTEDPVTPGIVKLPSSRSRQDGFGWLFNLPAFAFGYAYQARNGFTLRVGGGFVPLAHIVVPHLSIGCKFDFTSDP